MLTGLIVATIAAPIVGFAAAGRGKGGEGKDSGKTETERREAKQEQLAADVVAKISKAHKEDQVLLKDLAAVDSKINSTVIDRLGQTLSSARSDSKKIAELKANLKSAVEMSKSDKDASVATIMLLAVSNKTGAIQSNELVGKDAEDALLALQKLESMPKQILETFKGEEKTSYLKIISKYVELTIKDSKLTNEDALVKAIMVVMKVDKATALEKVRQLKECV